MSWNNRRNVVKRHQASPDVSSVTVDLLFLLFRGIYDSIIFWSDHLKEVFHHWKDGVITKLYAVESCEYFGNWCYVTRENRKRAQNQTNKGSINPRNHRRTRGRRADAAPQHRPTSRPFQMLVRRRVRRKMWKHSLSFQQQPKSRGKWQKSGGLWVHCPHAGWKSTKFPFKRHKYCVFWVYFYYYSPGTPLLRGYYQYCILCNESSGGHFNVFRLPLNVLHLFFLRKIIAIWKWNKKLYLVWIVAFHLIEAKL